MAGVEQQLVLVLFLTSVVILLLCSLKPWVVAIEGPRRIAADAAVFYCHERKGMQMDWCGALMIP